MRLPALRRAEQQRPEEAGQSRDGGVRLRAVSLRGDAGVGTAPCRSGDTEGSSEWVPRGGAEAGGASARG